MKSHCFQLVCNLFLLDWETVFLNATAATTPTLTYHSGALGGISTFLSLESVFLIHERPCPFQMFHL